MKKKYQYIILKIQTFTQEIRYWYEKILSQIRSFYNYEYQQIIEKEFIGVAKHKKKVSISIEEIATILINYHYIGYKNFKLYYKNYICKFHKRLFKYLPTYSWFLRLKQRALHFITCFLSYKTSNNGNFYIVDSKPIKVCHNKRINNHKVYSGVANRGCSSMDFFFGFKIHMIINDKSEICRVSITRANKGDREVLKEWYYYR